jgi:hypothetical protein
VGDALTLVSADYRIATQSGAAFVAIESAGTDDTREVGSLLKALLHSALPGAERKSAPPDLNHTRVLPGNGSRTLIRAPAAFGRCLMLFRCGTLIEVRDGSGFRWSEPELREDAQSNPPSNFKRSR